MRCKGMNVDGRGCSRSAYWKLSERDATGKYHLIQVGYEAGHYCKQHGEMYVAAMNRSH